jgi:tetratricopeptide (TPR) repeat protein
MMRLVRACVLIALSSTAMGCSLFAADIPRKVHGRIVVGRPVTPEAYAAYLEAATAEAAGQLDLALVWYQRAANEDPDSGDIWARIGAVQCALGQSPEAAFSRATREERDLASVWVARAQCDLKQGRIDAASRASRQALDLDPGNTDTALLVAQVLEQQGRLDDAQRWIESTIARDPSSERAMAALFRVATNRHDAPVAARARTTLDTIAAHRSLEPAPPRDDADHPRQVAPSQIDTALRRNDLRAAQRLAQLSRIAPETLATRAFELGKHQLALDQAMLVFGADPSNTTALIVLLLSADLLGDERRFAWAVSRATPVSKVVPELLREDFDRLLKRRSNLSAE